MQLSALRFETRGNAAGLRGPSTRGVGLGVKNSAAKIKRPRNCRKGSAVDPECFPCSGPCPRSGPPIRSQSSYGRGRKEGTAVHTPLEFYLTLPVDLFRLGRKNRAKLDYIRT